MPLFRSRKKKESVPEQRVMTYKVQQQKQVTESIEAGLYPTRVASRKGIKFVQYGLKVALLAFALVVLVSVSGVLDPVRKLFAPIQEGNGTLIVSSEYVRTQLQLDGKTLGQTPFTGENIPAGKHTLTIQAVDNVNNYFKEQSLGFEIFPGNTTIIKTNIAPDSSLFSYTIISAQDRSPEDAQLIVKALPQGVSVSVDGKQVGTTPYINENIPAGVHQLLLEKVGYKPVLLDITVVDDKLITIESKLYQYQLNLEK